MNTPTETTPKQARFDWYGATVDREPGDVVDHLRVALGASAALAAGPTMGYSRRVQLRRGDRDLAVVLGGGQPGVHVQVSGADSPEVARVVRRLFPVHRVARADAAIDFDGGREGFDQAAAVLRDVAGVRMKVTAIESGRLGVVARTLMVGSRTSEAYVRLYEKGLKDAPETQPEWVRFEVEVKPQNASRKALVATLEPLEVAGWTRATRRMLEGLFGLDVAELEPRAKRVSDDEGAELALVAQYGQIMARRAAQYGGWGSYGLRLDALIAERWPDVGRAAESCSEDIDVDEFSLHGQ